MPARFLWLLLIAPLLLETGCSTSRSSRFTADTNAAPAKAAAGDRLPLEQRAEAHAHFMAGLSYEQNRRTEDALLAFEKSLENDPSHELLAVELSRRYLLQKEYDKAVAVLKKAASNTPNSGLMHARLALVHLQQGDTNAAIEASRTAIRREPGSSAGYQSLFHLHRALGQTNEARKILDQATRQSKPSAPFLIDLAQMFLSLDAEHPGVTNSPSRVRAKEFLARAAALPNTNVVSLQKLAQGFILTGDMKRAGETYARILKQEPEMPGVREALAEIYLRENDPQKAAEHLKEIVRDNPTNPQACYFLGAIAYEEKRFEDALENYRKALLLGIDNQQIFFDMAAAQLALGRARDALDSLEKARKRFRRSFVGEFYSGLAYMRLKQYTNALEHFTSAEVIARATETNRLTHFFYFELGAAHERAGKIPESESYFRQCLKMKPDFAEALNYLGYMWAERGTNLVEARRMIEQAVKLNPTNSAYLDSLGWVLFKQGDVKAALGPIRKAIELQEEPDATLYDHLGDIYSALKEHGKAREAWRKSLEVEPNKEVEKKLKDSDPPPGPSSRK